MAINEKWRMRLVLGGAGLAQGVALWQIAELWPEEGKTATALATVAMGVVTFGLVFPLCWVGARQIRAVILALVTSILLAALLYWTWWQYEIGVDSDEHRIVVFLLTVPLALYALLPYLQIAARGRSESRIYVDLFLHGWNNAFLLSLAGVFTGLFWALLWLWAELFKLIGTRFSTIFSFRRPLAGLARRSCSAWGSH